MGLSDEIKNPVNFIGCLGEHAIQGDLMFEVAQVAGRFGFLGNLSMQLEVTFVSLLPVAGLFQHTVCG